MAYLTLEEYTTRGGALDAAGFERAEKDATALIDQLTARRAQEASGYKLDAVKEAAFRLIEASETLRPSRVKSVSNDGYSESYGDATPEAIDNQRRGMVLRCLSGTGLMGAIS